MNKIEISIIIPAYNVESYIEETLESILKQSFKSYEIIIVDDGSTDSTTEIINHYIDKYPGLIKFYKQKNGGQSSARNTALRFVEGKYITFIDSDDLIKKDYFEKLYNACEVNDADISVCGFELFDSDTGNFIRERNAKAWTIHMIDDIYHVFQYSPWGKLFKTSFIKKYNFIFSEGEQLEDGPYSVMTDILANKVISLEYSGYLYRERTGATVDILRKKKIKPKVPYKGIEAAINKVRKYNKDSRKDEILEFAIIKILAGLTTNMYKHCDKKTRKEVCNYCYTIINKYFPNVKNNRYIGIGKVKELPLSHRGAVKVFVLAYRLKLLYPFSLIISKVI